jgi:hypothetical protein
MNHPIKATFLNIKKHIKIGNFDIVDPSIAFHIL